MTQDQTKRRSRKIRAVSFAALSLAGLAPMAACSDDHRANEAIGTATQHLLGDGLVISQVYGGGGNANASFTNDFVELFNRSSADVSLLGLSVQYGSSTGNFANPTSDGGPGTGLTILPDVVVPAGGYFLIKMVSTANVGSPLPTSDLDGGTDLSGTNGKVALARITTSLGCGGTNNRCPSTNVVDMVGYGPAATDFEGAASTAVLSSTKSAARKLAGCTDSNSTVADFDVISPPTPRNSATPANRCDALDAGSEAGADADDGGIIVIGDDASDADDGAIDAGTTDDGAIDAGTTDDGAIDAGTTDDGAADAGTTDDGAIDAGTPDDAAIDATTPDDAAIDAATPDDAATDASTSDDAGVDATVDAGPPVDAGTPADPAPYAGIVISQVYGGGGNSGAPLNRDFVELFNRTNGPIKLDGLVLQYGSKAGKFGNLPADGGPSSDIFELPNATLAAGQYFLIGLDSNSTTGSALPAVDASGALKLAASEGKVALTTSKASLNCGATGARCATTYIVDMVGYGAASDFTGSAPTGALANTKAALRNGNGCVDTRDNLADFTAGAPAPRNTASPTNACGTVTTDGGVVTDAGSDAGKTDAGAKDSGVPESDSGVVDSGVKDSGASADSGTKDSGASTSRPDSGNPETTGDGGSAEGSGCSCRAAGGESSGGGSAALAAMVGLGLVIARRRRAAGRA